MRSGLRRIRARLRRSACSGLLLAVALQTSAGDAAPPPPQRIGPAATTLAESLPSSMPLPLDVPPAVGSSSVPVAGETDWWRLATSGSLRPVPQTIPVTLDGILLRTVSHSPQVRVFSDLPHIRRTAIAEAAAAWDWSAFVESRWDDIYEPVGNDLTTGGANRFSDHHVSGSAGVRRRTRSGGTVEASQRLGWQDTNSDFFIPDQQGTSRLSLSYTQPLLRGRGKAYNESLLLLAKFDTDVAEQEFSRQLQAHIVEVVRAYWGLYLERASFVQKNAALERAVGLRDRLKHRQQLDAVLAQIERADAEVALREVELLRARMAVANSESRLRSLVGDPALATTQGAELIPLDTPTDLAVPVEMSRAKETAVRLRPEVMQAIGQIKSASKRLCMSRNELLPTLNLVTELYVAGLEGDGSVGRSLAAQFDEGAPSYSIGLAYEVPINNRAAKARLTRKRLELRQLQNQYQTTLETLGLEVEAAVREVETSAAEVAARLRQTSASRTQLDYLQKRWELLPGEGQTSSLLLENLLDAQDRLADAEFALVSARVTRDLAVVNMKRATGELLQCEAIETGVGCVDGLPTTFLEKRPVRSSIVPMQPDGSTARAAEATRPHADPIFETSQAPSSEQLDGSPTGLRFDAMPPVPDSEAPLNLYSPGVIAP